MDKDTQNYIDQAAQKAATLAVAQIREFHLDDMKVLGERMDISFEGVNQCIDKVDSRLNRVESRLDAVESRLHKVENKIDVIDERIERVEDALAT